MGGILLVEGYNELNVELIPRPTWSITVAWDYTGDVGPGTDMETYAYRIDLRSWPDGEWSHPEHPELTGVWLPYTVTSIDIPSGYFPTPGYYEVRIVPGIGWHHTIYFHVDSDGKISAIEHKPATQDPRTIIVYDGTFLFQHFITPEIDGTTLGQFKIKNLIKVTGTGTVSP